MGFPPRAGQDGRWSLRQAQAAAGVTDRLVRSVMARGALGATGFLSDPDLLALQALAAAAGLPRSPDEDVARLRDADLASQCRAAWEAGAPGWALAVTETACRLAPDEAALAAALRVHGDEAVLVVPVGRWAAALRARIGAR